MYQKRILPFTDLGRDNAMTICWEKYNSSTAPNRVINVTIYAELNSRKVPYHVARMLKNSTASTYYNAVKDAILAVDYLHQLESQFIQVFNFGVKRLVSPLFLAGDRSFYGLDISTGNLPKLTTEAEVMAFGPTIVDGDASRMAVVGAVAMVFPTAGEIDAARIDARNKINAESTAKDAFGSASRALIALNLLVDPLIKQCADSAETFYSRLPAPAMRDACIGWGNVYISVGSGSVIKFTVLDSITHLPVDLMEGQVNKNGDSALSDPTGVLILNTTVVGTAAVNFSKINPSTGLEMYAPYAFALDIVDKSNVEYTVYVVKLA
ncbi:MAG TPA: hypothetical protein VN026_15205 [Bacteroidia bacterium]|jgi:hypothetical protein|nr:hypothetical protein [Bacteroidia bacterium]